MAQLEETKKSLAETQKENEQMKIEKKEVNDKLDRQREVLRQNG